jgi:phage portal protein BeeE
VNLFQRITRPRSASRFNLPQDFDPLQYLYNLNGRPVNGEYEVTHGNLDQITQQVYKTNGPVWALITLRMQLFAEARFQYQRLRNGRPGDLFGDQSLALLEHPFGPNSATGDMTARALQDVDLMGNAFITDKVTNGRPRRLRRMRPDWVTMVFGSDNDPELYGDAIDGELLGYVYTPRMPGAIGRGAGEATFLYPEEVAHFAPYPDPEALFRGMSWLTPVIREISADNAALEHKLAFFRNGASPRLAMRIDPSIEQPDFERLVAMIETHHGGPSNAYRTLYLGGGADPIPLTMNLRDLDYKAVTGGGETRLAAAAGVPPTIVGFSEGLAGSSLNAGNYQQSKRRLADATLRPLWRNFAGSLETLFPPPADARLWYDDRDISFLRDDSADAAEIASKQASTTRTLVDAGFKPETVVKAVQSGDFSGLVHTGLFSVQLQPPGLAGEPPQDTTQPTEPAQPGNGPKP